LLTPYVAPIAARSEVRTFDIVDIHEFGILGSIVARVAQKEGVHFLLRPHGSLPSVLGREKSFAGRLYSRIVEQPLLDKASRVVALTELEASQFGELGLDRRKVSVIPNGVDIPETSHCPERGAFRGLLGIGPELKVILFLGRLNHIKRIDRLVRVFRMICNERSGVKLVIVGPDDGYLREVLSLVHKLDLQRDVILAGPFYEDSRWMAFIDADIFVLPSEYETCPIAVLEACGLGIPTIVTDCCGLADFVREVGCVASVGDSALFEAIRNVLENIEVYRARARKGRDLVTRNFSWNKVVDLTERAYMDATETASRMTP
jgi:glycosyltransferase involved in cell wall biosynthesis